MVSIHANPHMAKSFIPRSNPDVHGTIMDGEMVWLNLSIGRYYTLNKVGAAIWEQCTGEHTAGNILEAICARFDVSPARAADDLTALMIHLEAEGLLSIERR